jgi:hypothetical protein
MRCPMAGETFGVSRVSSRHRRSATAASGAISRVASDQRPDRRPATGFPHLFAGRECGPQLFRIITSSESAGRSWRVCDSVCCKSNGQIKLRSCRSRSWNRRRLVSGDARARIFGWDDRS